ncbi:MAG: hypothetical protein ABI162_00125 [Luteolibacter sp.]
MKTSFRKRWKPGFISYVLVLTTGAILSLMMLFAYRKALAAHALQSQIQLRTDYSEKENAVLRSIVAITPNRAIRAMKGDSRNAANIGPLSWQSIFTESISLANAGTSVSGEIVTSLNIPNLKMGNAGDSALGSPDRIFAPVTPQANATFVSPGINRSLGNGYPVPLTCDDGATSTADLTYPIISSNKKYGALAQAGLNSATLNGDGVNTYGLSVADYSGFTRLKYPNINFGYAKPGDPFVAKRNWWAFSVDVAGNDSNLTKVALSKRNYVLSIYEIPSQLSISASSYMSFGQYASGEAWQNVNISGAVYASKAKVEGTPTLSSLSTRRSMTLPSDTTFGGKPLPNNPFAPGVRENYQLTVGDFFPVSLASESGRAAFVPINRGANFFDRFAHADETNAVSSTTWNNYSVGALQCAMRLDIIERNSAIDSAPTAVRFSYMKNGVRFEKRIEYTGGPVIGLDKSWTYCAKQDENRNFGTNVYEVAYYGTKTDGTTGVVSTLPGITGSVDFTNDMFGATGSDHLVYYRSAPPFDRYSQNGKWYIAVYPPRFKEYLAGEGADSVAVNNSLVVNVDYTSILLPQPLIPCTERDYRVVLKECNDMTSFPKGFSLVTNLRTYFDDNFNMVLYKDGVPATPVPAGYTGTADTYYPPCSIFAPEKRYGLDAEPLEVDLHGQIGSLASETDKDPVRPLDAKSGRDVVMAPSKIKVNLRPITHPAELPPITMMNWLILLEERRNEYYSPTGSPW